MMKWRRPLLLCAVLGAAGALFLGEAAPPREAVAEAPVTPSAPFQLPSLMAVHVSAEPEVRALPAAVLPPRPATSKAEALFPFRFLGRLGDGPEAAVVLFGNGRTLTVRAPGPLDADYAVDEMREHELVLRHVRLNVTRTLAFAAPATAPATAKRVEDFPQD